MRVESIVMDDQSCTTRGFCKLENIGSNPNVHRSLFHVQKRGINILFGHSSHVFLETELEELEGCFS